MAPVTDREFEGLLQRIVQLEMKMAGIEANYALLKFVLPTLISLAAVAFAVLGRGT